MGPYRPRKLSTTMIRLAAVLASVAMAMGSSLPVYAVHADAVVPANTVLTPELGSALIGHWTGENLALDAATSAAASSLFRDVDSPLLSTENAVVVVVHGLDKADAALGSPFVHIDSETPLPLPVSRDAKEFEATLKQIDSRPWAVAAVDASGVAPKTALKLLQSMQSRVLVVGAPARSLKDELRVLGQKIASPLGFARRDLTPTTPARPSYGPFESQEECDAATNGCSGHGECVKQRNTWACACKPSKDKSKKYTYYWGGYNCAKRDVSAQFHLLVWSTLLIGGIITGGIVLLFRMGSDPLPGILTAN